MGIPSCDPCNGVTLSHFLTQVKWRIYNKQFKSNAFLIPNSKMLLCWHKTTQLESNYRWHTHKAMPPPPWTALQLLLHLLRNNWCFGSQRGLKDVLFVSKKHVLVGATGVSAQIISWAKEQFSSTSMWVILASITSIPEAQSMHLIWGRGHHNHGMNESLSGDKKGLSCLAHASLHECYILPIFNRIT